MFDYLGGIVREHHWLKIKKEDHRPGKRLKYERHMVILKPTLRGRSAWIPDRNGWKFLDPKDNQDILRQDADDFSETVKAIQMLILRTPNAPDIPRQILAITTARRMHEQHKFLLSGAYTMACICQLLEITINDVSMFQLHNFIQDGLSDLRTMPPPQKEPEQVIGEMKIRLDRGGDVKEWEEPLTIKESEAKIGEAI